MYRITSYNVCYTKLLRDNEENSYYMTVNRSYLEIKRTLNLKDEEFWYYYGNNDFEGLNKLLAEGFDNYMGIYMTRAESPMIDAIEKRNFEMIKFLLDNGFSRITSYNVCYTKLLRFLRAFVWPLLLLQHRVPLLRLR